MAEYLHPGVYVEEIERGPRPIEGVPTSTAAMIGATERGPLRPCLVTSTAGFARLYGDVIPGGFLPHAVRGFFENGGQRLFVCRVTDAEAVTARAVAGVFEVHAAGPGDWGRRLWVAVRPGSTLDARMQPVGFRVSAAYFSESQEIYDPFDRANDARMPRPRYIEDYDDLSSDAASADYYEKRFSGDEQSVLFTLSPVPGVIGNSPALCSGLLDDAPVAAGDEPRGLALLDDFACRYVSLVCAPGADEATQRALVAHCEQSRFRFAVVDLPEGATDPTRLHPRTAIADSAYAACYWPWLWVADAAGTRVLVPPSGHVAGIYARTDRDRGVHKAPANEVVRGALDLEYAIDDLLQETLSPRGVNAIRSFQERGIRVWGARTLASDSLWKYVNVRRLFIYLERSIYEGTQWVVFEPNNENLWARVKDTIRLFLRATWRNGALLGTTEDEAFFVACDRSTMSQDDIESGRLICEIGVAPLRPAEFVIFRLFHHIA